MRPNVVHMLALGCVTTLLSGRPLGAQAGGADHDERVYLKRDGNGGWVRAQRGPGGWQTQPSASPSVVAGGAEAAAAGIGAGCRPTGPFEPYVATPTGSWPEAVAIGDVNGDGRNDVVMTTSSYFDPANDNRVHVFLQSAAGALLPAVKYPVGTRPQTVALGDVNGDGRTDVVVGNFDSQTIGILLQNLSGSLDAMVTRATVNSFKVRIGDLNGDGRQDIVGINWGSRGDGVDVFLQQPDGSIGSPVTYHVAHDGYDDLDVGDVDGDGLADVIVMSGQGFGDNLGVLRQQADGTLASPVYYDLGGNQLTQGVAVGDVTSDGLNDVVVSYGGNRPASHIATFRQNASGSLDAPASLESYDIPEPVEIGDVNLDGRPDVLVAHGGWQQLGVYLQNPDGTLAAEQLYPLPYASHYNTHGLAVGDINGDGANDVVIADYNYGLVVLRHRTTRPQISACAATGVPGQAVDVSAWNGPAGRGDWVGLYLSSAPDSSLIAWKYLNDTKTLPSTGLPDATVGFGLPWTAGTYNFRFFANNGFTRLATSQNVVVQPPPPPTLSVSATSINGGQVVTLTMSGGPGSPTDWVGLYAKGAPNSGLLNWKYLNGTRTAPAVGYTLAWLDFVMPTPPGDYEFRFFASNQYVLLASSPTVTVQVPPPAAIIATPFTVLAGETVAVQVTGPGDPTDWVALFRVGAADTAYLDWKYLNGTRTAPLAGLTAATLAFKMPMTPGVYEFRFFAHNGYSRLATSNTVTVN